MMTARHFTAQMVAIFAVLVCFLVYLPVLLCDFINWDDPLYIIDNPAIRVLDLQFVREALTTSYMGWWMPLTWISFALDYYVWELNPLGYHLTNAVLHAANTGLVVLIADQLLQAGGRGQGTGDRGTYLYPATLLLAGLLWGLHPLRVESVAWVTERKDVLNGFFALAAILYYLRYARMKDLSGISAAVVRSYLLALLFLLLSLMSKPVSVVIPAMLLVADWYPLKRLQKGMVLRILLEKVPFVIMVLALSASTLYFAAGNRILVSYGDLPLASRFLLAGHSLFEYCRLSLYPVGIIHLYLLPWPLPPTYTVKALIVLVFSCYCFWQYWNKPWLPATWLAFILPLVPVLGFFQNGAQSHAARFTYLAGVAPGICTAAVLAALYHRAASNFRIPRSVPAALVAVPLLVYGVITGIHIAAWKNPETLWSRVIAIQPVGRAYYLRADYYLQNGRFREAAGDLLMSIDMGRKAGYPMLYNLHALRGDALSKSGQYAEAAEEFTHAISLSPNPNYYYHRALTQKVLGNLKEAEADFLQAGDRTEPIEWRELK
jgi:hypothetical protein